MRIFKKNTVSFMLVPFKTGANACQITEQQVRDFMIRIGERDFTTVELVNDKGSRFRIKQAQDGKYFVERL